MTYQKIISAEDDDGKIKVKTSKNISLMLKDCDIEKARKQLNLSRPVKTEAQRKIFCRCVEHKIIDVSSLGGAENKDIKQIAKEAAIMGKNKKVEWKFDGNKKSIGAVYEDLTAIRAEIKTNANFRGFTQAKKGDSEEKRLELTIMANFETAYVDTAEFDTVCVAIQKKILEKLGAGVEMISFEVKE
jgi:hypothetical protein